MRLIDADALLDFIDVGHLRHPSELCFSEIDVANMLLHAPTISADDARGVGKWIPLDYSDEAYGNMYKCAKCGCSEIGEPNYCPNCGAKMEVSEDDE